MSSVLVVSTDLFSGDAKSLHLTDESLLRGSLGDESFRGATDPQRLFGGVLKGEGEVDALYHFIVDQKLEAVVVDQNF